MQRRRSWVAISIALAAVACNHYDGNPVDIPNAQGAAHLDIASGNNQSAAINSPLPSPLSVVVTDTKGAAVPNVAVSWVVVTGRGSLTANTVVTDANGLASVGWTLGSTLGSQSVRASVTGLSVAAVFAATALSSPPDPTTNTGGTVILRYNGSAWTSSVIDGSGIGLSFSSIWGSSQNQIFAVGKCRGVAMMSTFDGSHWTVPSETACSGGTLARYTSVWGSSSTDAYAILRTPVPPSLNTTALHYDGQRWTTSYFTQCSMCAGMTAIWSSTATNAIAVGDSGMVVRYDGNTWSKQSSGTTVNLNAVWSAGAANPIFAVGDAGTALIYFGSAKGWETQSTGTTQSLHGVWGSSPTDVFVVGSAGTILHYDGTSWTLQPSGTTQNLYGVWGAGSNSVFAVGDGSTVLHYDGTGWSKQAVDVGIDIAAIWGSSAENIFAVGTAKYPSSAGR